MKRFLLIIAALLLAALHLSGAEAWKARWIARSYCTETGNVWVAFQKKVELQAVPSVLPAKIAADSKYWLWINGEMVVNEGGLKRGPAPGDGYYDTVDIAPYLKAGQNCISVLVWYFGRSGFSHMGSGICTLLFEAVGDGVEILSDDSWDACQHFAYGTASGKTTNYRLSENNVRYDARRFNAEWYKGTSKKLGSAYELGIAPGSAPLGRLVPRPIPLWKDYGLRDYESVRRSGDTLICHLPYNAQFSPYMELEAAEGKVVRLVTDHDDVFGAKCVGGEYVTRAGAQSYEHLPWMNGEYMYYIVPEGVSVGKVQFRETGYDCGFDGYFRCDDPLLNEYWQKAQRTLYVCMRDTWMDCPDRERAQWIGDVVHDLGEAAYALGTSSAALTRKGLLEFFSWAKPDGSVYAPVPCSNWFKELAQQSLAAAGWYGLHDYWFYTGDDALVSTVYPALRKYLHETWSVDAEDLPVERTKGWNWADAGKDIDKMALLHPWYYLALKGEQALAGRLEKMDDVAVDEAMMERLKESYNRLFWNGSFYRTPGYDSPADDRVQALAVVSGIAGPDKYDAILRVLDERREAETYFMRYIIEAYFVMGRPEKALERLREYASCVMKPDYSTLWEHRNHHGSSNHAWSGHGIILMGQRLAGIVPLKPGFEEFTVRPQMASLKHIACRVPTPFGPIEVVLERRGRAGAGASASGVGDIGAGASAGRRGCHINASINVPPSTTAVVTDSRGHQLRLSPGIHKVVL